MADELFPEPPDWRDEVVSTATELMPDGYESWAPAPFIALAIIVMLLSKFVKRMISMVIWLGILIVAIGAAMIMMGTKG